MGKSTRIPSDPAGGNIYVPVPRQGPYCDSQHPERGYWCSRPGGHTGRHAFFWRFTGRLRAVWGEAA